MNIIFGKSQLSSIDSKYTVLELDTLKLPSHVEPVTAYCIVESIPIVEMATIDQYRDLHKNLMKNYRNKNWQYCQEAIGYLKGKWNGELDSFYQSLEERIQKLIDSDLNDEWTGIIDRTMDNGLGSV